MILIKKDKVIGIFDVRQVQRYIFRSKRLSEIIGASRLVEKSLKDSFEFCVKKETTNFNFEWRGNKNRNDDYINNQYSCQVAYYGGGNLLAIFDSKDFFNKISREMAVYLVKNTFGLSIVSACTEITGDYQADYKKLQDNLSLVKAETIPFLPQFALTITDNDRYNGLPLTSISSKGERISKESELKLKSALTSMKINISDLIEEKGKDSSVAIMHIDGNGIGQKIMNLTKDLKDYTLAIDMMRDISEWLSDLFDGINKKINKIIENITDGQNSKSFLRNVILAGDDATYICNSKIAIDCARIFLNEIEKCTFRNDGKTHISACAGIVFVNMKFPFYTAYELAEQCCESAKKKAKLPEMIKTNGGIGSYIDFEIIKSGSFSSIEDIRESNIRYCNEIKPYKRPYGVNVKDNEFNIDNFISAIDLINNGKIGRSWLKELRDLHLSSKEQIKEFKERAESRGKLFKPDIIDENNFSNYYDALDIMDYYSDILYKQYEQEEKNSGNR